MDGYICMAVSEISCLQVNVLKINLVGLPQQCSPTPLLQQKGAVLCLHWQTAQENKTITMQNPAGLHGKPGVQRTQNTLRIGENNYEETSTNYQRPSLILYSTFSWKY